MPDLITPRGLHWHYEITGQGPTLLFLHGFGVNHRIWRQQSKYFSEHYQVIALDLPGHGQSDWQEVTLQCMAQDVEFLLQHLNCSEVGIIASSFGGLVALKLFELNKGRVKFFVFAGSQPKFCRSPDYPFGLEAQRIHKLANQLNSDYPSMVHIFFRSLFTRQERATRRFRWIQTFKKFEDVPSQAALLNVLKILEQADLRTVFYALQLPVLFVNGTEDYICQRDFYEGLEQKMTSARFHWFERCGHFPFLSQPHEFNRAVEKFLESCEI
ncbi:MAG: alpha/beta hydrolase [Candidatus Omnitrophica bacterium]|nr:alpha/beta hydrolase [Candidatus Omnitrophota bacterium]